VGILQKQVYIGVIGAAECDESIKRLAEEVGSGIARLGAVLICGGRGGVMESASRGAREAGGTVVGILPGDNPRGGNDHLSLAIATGLGDARNAVIARACDILVAVDGGYGTLSEIGLALKMGKPVIGLNSWQCVDSCGKKAEIYEAVDAAGALMLVRRLLDKLF
jgi:uncharacterized protein (TIGR00725 family)